MAGAHPPEPPRGAGVHPVHQRTIEGDDRSRLGRRCAPGAPTDHRRAGSRPHVVPAVHPAHALTVRQSSERYSAHPVHIRRRCGRRRPSPAAGSRSLGAPCARLCPLPSSKVDRETRRGRHTASTARSRAATIRPCRCGTAHTAGPPSRRRLAAGSAAARRRAARRVPTSATRSRAAWDSAGWIVAASFSGATRSGRAGRQRPTPPVATRTNVPPCRS